MRARLATVVQRCIDEALVGGEGFAVDASLIQADANKQRPVPGSEWNPANITPSAEQAVKDYLARLDDAALGAASEVTGARSGNHRDAPQARFRSGRALD